MVQIGCRLNCCNPLSRLTQKMSPSAIHSNLLEEKNSMTYNQLSRKCSKLLKDMRIVKIVISLGKAGGVSLTSSLNYIHPVCLLVEDVSIVGGKIYSHMKIVYLWKLTLR